MAEMSGAGMNDLPDSAFAYIEPGGKKDSSGRTVPRSLRHFPIHDAAHVRNALARMSQSEFGEQARAKIMAAARRFGIEVAEKAWPEPMKAEALTTPQMDLWLQGRRARRVLVLPFTGPLPGGKAGLDLDGEYFDDETDIHGGYAALRRTRERLVDWHHDRDPTGAMKGAILGRVVLDEDPEADGRWADFWANAGERRRTLLARLEESGVPLYGSSQAIPAGVRKASDGHIEVWPLIRHTITTSPQNTHAVVPALKALLEIADTYEALTVAALQAAMVGAGTDSPLGTLRTLAERPGERAGERSGKADGLDPRARLEEAIDQLSAALSLRS